MLNVKLCSQRHILNQIKTSTIESFFAKIRWWLVAINYFCKSAPSYVDVWLAYKHASNHAKWCHEIVLFCNIFAITSLSFVSKNGNITLKNTANFTRLVLIYKHHF